MKMFKIESPKFKFTYHGWKITNIKGTNYQRYQCRYCKASFSDAEISPWKIHKLTTEHCSKTYMFDSMDEALT